MHLVLLTSQFPTPNDINGAVFSAQLAKAFAKKVHLTVVCPVPWCPNIPLLRDMGTCKWYAGIPHKIRHGDIDVYFPRYPFVPRLSNYIQPWFQALPLKRFLTRLNSVVRIDAINAHWLFPDAVSATWVASKLDIPILVTALGSDVNVAALHPIRRRQIQWALSRANASSGVSRALTERLRALGAGAATNHFIPNGIDTERFYLPTANDIAAARTKLGLAQDRRYLLFLGRLHPVKGLSHLIEALGTLHRKQALDFDTLLVGTGALHDALKEAARSLGIADRVHFAGEVAHENVPFWLRAADALCLPSLMEGMPNVVLEAQACGLPVIASRVGALPDLVNDNNGILVDAANSDALAGALKRAFSRRWDRDAIVRSQTAASWDTVAAQYLDVMDALVRQQAAGDRAAAIST
jgi:teichuronic acid biosynthesis glycosyltransferase TuaC